MTEDIIQSMSLNKILIAILEQYGELIVSTDKMVNVDGEEKQLVVEYDDENLSFKFSLRNGNE